MRPAVPAFLAAVLASPAALAASPTWLDAPPPLPKGAAPAPAPEPEEHARRTWELAAHAGAALAGCRTPDAAPGPCDGANPGLDLGGAVLARAWPHVAIGLGADFASHGFDARERPVGATGTALATRFVGPVFRGYFLEEGALDPWIQLGLGAGRSRWEETQGGASLDATSSGFATWASAGLDVWATSWLKVGPAIAHRMVLASDATVCTAGGPCVRRATSEVGAATSSLSATLVVTVALGRAM